MKQDEIHLSVIYTPVESPGRAAQIVAALSKQIICAELSLAYGAHGLSCQLLGGG